MDLTPRWRSRLPAPKRGADFFGLSKFFENLEDELALFTNPSGLSVYSDEKSVYVEADVPGLTAKEVDVSIDQEGVLWIKGQKKIEEENKEKKYYRRAQQEFSYCVPLGDEVDLSKEPQATYKNGIMKLTFSKTKEKQVQAKKINVKEEE